MLFAATVTHTHTHANVIAYVYFIWRSKRFRGKALANSKTDFSHSIHAKCEYVFAEFLRNIVGVHCAVFGKCQIPQS